MAAPRTALALGIVALAASLGACAGIVGADFDDVHGSSAVGDDGGIKTIEVDGSTHDASQGVPLSEAGTCPTRFADCSGTCFDISTSPLHCGDCATSCPSDPHGAAVCVASHCELACNDGYAQCSTGCCSVDSIDASSSTDASTDGSSVVDAGKDSGVSSAGIPCGGATCTDGTSFCCGGATEDDGGMPGDMCLAVNGNSDLQCPYYFACAGTADCANQGGGICCYDTNTDQNDDNYQSSFCATDSSQCDLDSSQYIQLCRTEDDCVDDTDCTGSLTEQGVQTAYGYCQ